MIQKNWKELIKPNKLEVARERRSEACRNDGRRAARAWVRHDARQRAAACPSLVASGRRGDLRPHRRRPARVLVDPRRPRRRDRHRPQHQDDRDPHAGGGLEAPDALRKSGPGTVTAGDINDDSGDIQILNPDLVLCTLDEGAEIRMEFTVIERARAMSPAERNRPEDAPIGLIPVDSLFSPVQARCPIGSRIPARARTSTRTS